MKTERARYQGVLQILHFNWPFYALAIGLLMSGSLIAVLVSMPNPVSELMNLGLGLAAAWLILSLLVAHYVYDRSPLYRADWLCRTLRRSPRRYAAFHVGLDEFSGLLRSAFPQSEGRVLDFFDRREMTESSIHRARRRHRATLAVGRRVDFRALPFHDSEFDSVFLIFSAHELRHRSSRWELFCELSRILVPRGQILLVEHVRDLANFLAFGPGALHFHSRAEWLHATGAANLVLAKEFRLTPFVRVLVLEKQDACSNFLPTIQPAKLAAVG